MKVVVIPKYTLFVFIVGNQLHITIVPDALTFDNDDVLDDINLQNKLSSEYFETFNDTLNTQILKPIQRPIDNSETIFIAILN